MSSDGKLKARLTAGRPLTGSICVIASADTAETMARSGFDLIMLDMQHGFIDRGLLTNVVRSMELAGTPALVRVPMNSPEYVGWVLDAGAQGVVAPMINSAADAERLVAACRFAPAGSRSWGPLRPTLVNPAYVPRMGDDVVVCVMIETPDAMRNLDAILDVPGIDLVLVGQSDLCVSHGLHPAEGRSDPAHQQRLERITAASRARGIPTLVNCSTAQEALRLRGVGFDHMLAQSDLVLLRAAALSIAAEVSRALSGTQGTGSG